MAKTKKELNRKPTPKQKAFAELLAQGELSQTECYLRVYNIAVEDKAKKRKQASKKATQLMRLPWVKEYYDSLIKEAFDKNVMGVNELLLRLSDMARNCINEENIVTDKEGNYKIVDTKTKNKDALKAMELLGKYYKIFVDSMKIDANANSNVNITFVDDLEDDVNE